METFSDKLRAIRSKRRLTQVQLAEALGVSNGTVAHWERGTSRPKAVVFDRLCEYLRVDGHELLDDYIAPSDHDGLEKSRLESAFVPSESVQQIINDCIKLTGQDLSNDDFIIDCIYRRWTELKHERLVSDAMREKNGVREALTKKKKEQSKELPVDEKN